MAKEKVNKLRNYTSEDLKKQVSVCKKLRIVFIVVGIVLTLGGGFLFFYGFAHVWAGIFAIIFSGGYADDSELMNQGGGLMFGGMPVFFIGLATIIAGPIVTSVKIKNRKKELIERGEAI